MRHAIVIFGMVGLVACSRSDSPETQVRHVIEQMELAAEARDASELIEHVSREYRDAYGQGRDELTQYVRGYFLANQSIHLLSRIDRLDFTTGDEARAIVRVGMAAREAEANGDWSLAADLYEFDVVFRRDEEGWKVSYAEWSRP
jgi:hypothetical protein